MAEIINNTLQTITLIEARHGVKKFKEHKIHPQDSLEIDDNLWAKFKKNSKVKELIVNNDLKVLEEAPTILTKIKNFFY